MGVEIFQNELILNSYSLIHIPIALIIFWSFFIPLKIQEWSGVLPPSYRLLIEKQRMLARRSRID